MLLAMPSASGDPNKRIPQGSARCWPQNGKCSHTILTHLKPGLGGRNSWAIILSQYFLNTLIIPQVTMKKDKWLERRKLK
jgi:hypothetical protein